MKKGYIFWGLGMILSLSISSCKKNQEQSSPIQKQNDPMEWQNQKGMPDPIDEDAGLIIPEEDLIRVTHDMILDHSKKNNLKWKEATHNQITYICAKKLGLNESRALVMGEASEMPDFTQNGIQNGFNLQWSHAYLYSYWGHWIWGDADEDLHDNIDGASPGEGHEGYADKSASYFYNKGAIGTGDWYVGYATHYMEDVCQPLHATFILPWISTAIHHFDYEAWIDNNWTEGHRFVDVVKGVSSDDFYHITNLHEAVYKASANASIYKNDLSKDLWNSYGDSNYPTGAGEGNKVAVENTRKMLREAAKWTGGVIKYSLDKYQQWD